MVFYSGDPWNATIGTIAKTAFQELKESKQTSQNLKNVIWDEHRSKIESCYLRRHLSNQLSWKMGLLKCLFFLDKYRFQSKTFATVLLTRKSLGRENTCTRWYFIQKTDSKIQQHSCKLYRWLQKLVGLRRKNEGWNSFSFIELPRPRHQ